MSENKKHYNKHKKHGKADNYKPPFPDNILAEPITNLSLKEETSTLLIGAGLNTIGDILKRSETDFYKICHFNKKNLTDVKFAVKKRNLFLKPLPVKETEDGAIANSSKESKDSEEKPTNSQQPKPEIKNKDNRPTQSNGKPEQVRPQEKKQKPAKNNNQTVENRKQNEKQKNTVENRKQGEKQTKDKPNKPAQNEHKTQERQKQQNQNKENNVQRKEQPLQRKDQSQRKEQTPPRNKEQKEKKKHEEKYVFTTIPEKPPRPEKVVIKEESDRYVKINKGGLWGFRDRETKEMVVPAVYDEVFNFKEDICCVQKNEKFGFINRQGEEIIPVIYDCATSFSEGYACVFKGDLCGYINTSNETVVDFKFTAGTPMINGECRVKKENKWGELHIENPTEIRWII